MAAQQTLKREVKALGIGLHSGCLIEMRLKPSAPNSGIRFVRTDLNGASVKARISDVDFSALQLATTLKNRVATVQTTEHLMAAMYAKGVDNAVVEISGSEVPIMDGSAAPFLYLIEEAGIRRQQVARRVLVVREPFDFEESGKRLSARPGKGFSVTYEIDFDHPMIQHQEKTVMVTPRVFDERISRARTFGFLRDVNALKAMGLIRGGSLDNAIVLDGDRILNESLRYDDEFVSHKILDFVGDMALCGMRVRGAFHAVKAGHEIHARFLRQLLAHESATSIEEEPLGASVSVPAVAPLQGALAHS